MSQEQLILVPMTIEEFYERKEQRKLERSRRLAKLPTAKKLEIVEKFRDILNDALREDDERRAADPSPGDEH